jgi:hypothetical protein
MERLEQDLKFYKLELEGETDQHRRNLLLDQIRNVEREIVRLLSQEAEQLESDRRNYEIAINKLKAKKK